MEQHHMRRLGLRLWRCKTSFHILQVELGMLLTGLRCASRCKDMHRLQLAQRVDSEWDSVKVRHKDQAIAKQRQPWCRASHRARDLPE